MTVWPQAKACDYGGEPYTRAEAILDMQRTNTPQPCIDRWLQGYEHAQRRREPNQRTTLLLWPQNARARQFADALSRVSRKLRVVFENRRSADALDIINRCR